MIRAEVDLRTGERTEYRYRKLGVRGDEVVSNDPAEIRPPELTDAWIFSTLMYVFGKAWAHRWDGESVTKMTTR